MFGATVFDMTGDNVASLQPRRALATSTEVARYLGTTPAGLAQMRFRHKGPPFVKVGPRKVMYSWPAVEKWVEANTRV